MRRLAEALPSGLTMGILLPFNSFLYNLSVQLSGVKKLKKLNRQKNNQNLEGPLRGPSVTHSSRGQT